MSGCISVLNMHAEKVAHINVREVFCNVALIKNYVVLFLGNQRQWSANTKTRAEVAHSTRKVRRQKGGGVARLGTYVVPQCVGGGRVGGPRPKFDVRRYLNKKETRLVFVSLLSDKIAANKVFVLSEDFGSIEKTAMMSKVIAGFRKAANSKKKVCFVFDSNVERDALLNFERSTRNIEGVLAFDAACLNGYDVLSLEAVFFSSAAWSMLSKVRLHAFNIDGCCSKENVC